MTTSTVPVTQKAVCSAMRAKFRVLTPIVQILRVGHQCWRKYSFLRKNRLFVKLAITTTMIHVMRRYAAWEEHKTTIQTARITIMTRTQFRFSRGITETITN